MRPRSAAGGAALVTVAAVAMTSPGGAQEPVERVSSFPMPGTAYARTETQISFRGATAETLGPISVTGSRSGAHSGSLRDHGDGQGASFLPSERFVAGERVTVQTHLDIDGARDRDYSFSVARRPTGPRRAAQSRTAR
jgi:hypothetical protein